MSGDIKCVKKGNDDKCVVPESGIECQCPQAPPVVLVEKKEPYPYRAGTVPEEGSQCKVCGVPAGGVECKCPAALMAIKAPYPTVEQPPCNKINGEGKCEPMVLAQKNPTAEQIEGPPCNQFDGEGKCIPLALAQKKVECVSRGTEGFCYVPGSDLKCTCQTPKVEFKETVVLPKEGLSQKKVECTPRGTQGFCYVPGSDLKCTCQTPKVEYTEQPEGSVAPVLSQKDEQCERKGTAGYCTRLGTETKCKCPKEAISLVEYGACTKYTGGFGSTACMMKGTEFPTEKNVYCVCPESESLAQEDPEKKKKKLPMCGLGPDGNCHKRDPKEQCQCPVENTLAQVTEPKCIKQTKTPETNSRLNPLNPPSIGNSGCVIEGTEKFCMCNNPPSLTPELLQEPKCIKDTKKDSGCVVEGTDKFCVCNNPPSLTPELSQKHDECVIDQKTGKCKFDGICGMNCPK